MESNSKNSESKNSSKLDKTSSSKKSKSEKSEKSEKLKKEDESLSSINLNQTNLSSAQNISLSDNSKLIQAIKEKDKPKTSYRLNNTEMILMENLKPNKIMSQFDMQEKIKKNLVQIQKKKKIDAKTDKHYLRKMKQETITNLYSFDFDNIKIDQIFLFSIKVEDCNGKENPHYGLVKRITRIPEFRKFLNTYFHDYYVSGNNLFAEMIDESNVMIKVAIFYQKDTLKIIDIEKVIEFEPENVYIITITKKFNIKEFIGTSVNSELTDKNHILRFLTSIVSRALEKNNYKKTDSSAKSLFYKMDPSEYINATRDIYFVNGVKIVPNFYDGSKMLCKGVQRFRMLRTQTYWDVWTYFESTNNQKAKFYEECKGKQGFTMYSERNIKIDDIDFDLTPKTCYMTLPNGTKKNLIQYYAEKYNIQIKDPNQPLFCNEHIRRTKDKSNSTITQINYYIPELLQVVGKLSFDEFNVARYTLLSPNDKFNTINNVMRELREYQNKISEKETRIHFERMSLSKTKNTDKSTKKIEEEKTGEGRNRINEKNLNFQLKKINTFILKPPQICVKNKDILVPNEATGEFSMRNQTPLDNENLKNWAIFFYDVSESDWGQIQQKMETSLKGLNLKIENNPRIRVIDRIDDKRKKNEKLFEIFTNHLEILKEEAKENKKKDKDFAWEIVLLIISKHEKDIYTPFKEAINNSNLYIPSQVFKKETVLMKDLSVISNIFLQMWAKTESRIWRTERIKDEENSFKDTMIIGYSCSRSQLNKFNSVSSISASYDRSLSKFMYFSKISDYTGKVCNVIGELFEKVLQNYKELNKKYPKKIIIYREGVSMVQRKFILEMEFDPIWIFCNSKDIKITFIFVNSLCDMRLYTEISNKKDQEGIDIYDLTIDSFKSNTIANVIPGTICDDIVTNEKEWDFYMTSCYTRQGTSNPTHYVVYYDDSEIRPVLLYKLTFDLCFMYYNNQKCIRIPGPLKNSLNMTNFIAKYLTNRISTNLKFKNVSL